MTRWREQRGGAGLRSPFGGPGWLYGAAIMIRFVVSWCRQAGR
ncbi:MAG: hypothetical protein QXU79_00710 [Candidatus Micrarchaeaceae archaeon]